MDVQFIYFHSACSILVNVRLGVYLFVNHESCRFWCSEFTIILYSIFCNLVLIFLYLELLQMDVFVYGIFPVLVSFAFYFCNWFVTLIKIWSQNFSLFGAYCEICFSPTKRINFCVWSLTLRKSVYLPSAKWKIKHQAYPSSLSIMSFRYFICYF